MSELSLWYPVYETIFSYEPESFAFEREYQGYIKNDELDQVISIDNEDDAEDECALRNAEIEKEMGLK